MSTTTAAQTAQTAQTQQTDNPEDTVLTTTQDAEAQSPITRVVAIAIDQSPHSQQAFDWALKNFLRKDSDLVKINMFVCI